MNLSRNRAAVIAAGVLAAAGTAAAVMAPSASAARPPVRPAVRCVTFDVTGPPPNGRPGHPWDEPVGFCGRGLPSGMWMCPAKTPVLGPGTRLTGCSEEP